jgi:coniferyl-aldehyde dehydrogenase
MARAAGSIMFGKCFNAGQTCIAPDYALTPRDKVGLFVEATRSVVAGMYPKLAGNPDYTSIVSERHYQRLQGLLRDAEEKGAKTIALNPAGENFDPALRKIPPTLVLDARPDMAIMQEEIFGPLLPVVGYDKLDEAVAFINERDRPLALYWFGENAANRDHVLANTISGGVTINDTLLHFAQEEQPFGGVGPSGMGAYHGHWGFDAFSKLKPVFYQSKFNGAGLLRPPYGATFDRILSLIRKFA